MRLDRRYISYFVLLSAVLACAPRSREVEAASVQPRVSLADSKNGRPRLVVWLTVDQMRGDYFRRYRRHFERGGFAWLLDNGRVFSQAHFGHAITETAPGHATLFTGVSPREHGIIANEWVLSDGTEVSSVSDDETRLVGPAVEGEAGKSPRKLLVPTIGDALRDHTDQRARVVSISVKDRGAILPGGQRGLAYWLGPGGFVTSTYYAEEAPGWLQEAHREHPMEAYLSEGWQLSRPEASYLNEQGRSAYAPQEWGAEFPHDLSPDAAPAGALANSPFGDIAVLDLALDAIEGERLGEDEVVDLLAISLSSTDKIGHQYGPESRELEDQLIRLNDHLGTFFEKLFRLVPMDDVVVVLSADHGGSESAEFLAARGQHGRRLTEAALEEEVRKALLARAYPVEFLLQVASPYVYLNRPRIAELGIDLHRVREEVAEVISRFPGVFVAHPLHVVPDGSSLGKRLFASLNPERSGDIYVVPQRRALFLQSESLGATHGSPWEYDTHVPLVIVGTGAPRGLVDAPVDIRSLVPTVARMIGVAPPRGASAPVLPL